MDVQGAEVALWGFYGFDTFPEFKMDPDLAAVLGLITMMGETLIEQLTPDRLEALERFQGKLMQARAERRLLALDEYVPSARANKRSKRPILWAYVLALRAHGRTVMGGRTL